MLKSFHFVLVGKSTVTRLVNGRSCAACNAFIRGAATSAAKKEEPVQVAPRELPESSSFAMNMFRGQIKTEQVFPYPDVLTDEQKQTTQLLLDPTTKFCEEVNNPAKNDTLEKVEDHTMEGLRQLGAFGLQVPTEYGGLGLNNTQYCRLISVMGGNDLGLGIALGAHQSIGFKGILLVGTDAQKVKYLPDLASGKKMAAFCLTEPTSGSDANSIRTKVTKSEDGSHYIMNGSKIWISNGGVADIFTVFAQLSCMDKKTGTMKDKVSAFIVERAFTGVSSGPPEKKMGIKASNTAEVYFEDVKIPKENLLGEEGEGFKVAMNILNNGRFGMAGALAGTMKNCIKTATEFASTRKQFGDIIGTYGVIQEKIARMALAQYVTECMAFMVSSNMDRGSTEYHLEAAISKIYASEAAWFCVDEAIQVMGGMGYMKECGLERVMRDVRIFRIFEGTNDILRLFVSLAGMQYAGAPLKQLQKAIKNPAANLGLVIDAGTKRAKRMAGLTTVQSIRSNVHPDLAECADQISKSIDQFGLMVETQLIKYGNDIVHQQFVLHRVANVAIDIYSMVVVLSRASRSLQQGEASARHEANLCMLLCDEASERVNQGVRSINKRTEKNFQQMTEISKVMLESNGVPQNTPLGF